MSLTPKQQLEQVNNPNLLSILSTIQGLPEQVDPLSDTDLIPSNIREGIDIWGVIGTLVEGVAGIDFGEVTLASSATSVTVSHNLGVVPSWVALIPKSLATTSSSSSLFNINGKTAYTAFSSNPLIHVESAANTLSAEEITFATHSNPFAATGYYWFALA